MNVINTARNTVISSKINELQRNSKIVFFSRTQGKLRLQLKLYNATLSIRIRLCSFSAIAVIHFAYLRLSSQTSFDCPQWHKLNGRADKKRVEYEINNDANESAQAISITYDLSGNQIVSSKSTLYMYHFTNATEFRTFTDHNNRNRRSMSHLRANVQPRDTTDYVSNKHRHNILNSVPVGGLIDRN